MSLDPSDQQPAITLSVSFRRTTHSVALPLSSPLYTLHTQLEDLTDVPPALQKLLYKGKKLVWKSEEDAQSTTVEKAGLRDGMKVQLLGSTLKELEGLKREEGEHLRRERIMRDRASKPPVKVSCFIPWMICPAHLPSSSDRQVQGQLVHQFSTASTKSRHYLTSQILQAHSHVSRSSHPTQPSTT
jgi:hypothetical protein